MMESVVGHRLGKEAACHRHSSCSHCARTCDFVRSLFYLVVYCYLQLLHKFCDIHNLLYLLTVFYPVLEHRKV